MYVITLTVKPVTNSYIFFLCQQDNDAPAKKPKKDGSEVSSNSNILYQFYHETFTPVYTVYSPLLSGAL